VGRCPTIFAPLPHPGDSFQPVMHLSFPPRPVLQFTTRVHVPCVRLEEPVSACILVPVLLAPPVHLPRFRNGTFLRPHCLPCIASPTLAWLQSLCDTCAVVLPSTVGLFSRAALSRPTFAALSSLLVISQLTWVQSMASTRRLTRSFPVVLSGRSCYEVMSKTDSLRVLEPTFFFS